MQHLYAALAERERNLICERTNAALEAAKARGQALGNPKLAEARAIANARRQGWRGRIRRHRRASHPRGPGRRRRRFGRSPRRSTVAASGRRGTAMGAAGGRERASANRVSARADALGGQARYNLRRSLAIMGRPLDRGKEKSEA